MAFPTHWCKSEPTQYKITRELLSKYWDAATDAQRTYLNDNFKLDGSTTNEAIIGLHDLACTDWKPTIKKNHPDCFSKGKWNRAHRYDKESYYFITRDTGEKGTAFRCGKSGPCGGGEKFSGFLTEDEASDEAKIYNLMMMMRSFAKFHNEGWKPDEGKLKHGIGMRSKQPIATDWRDWNGFLFQIEVKDIETAKAMLEEFKADIEEIAEYL